MEEKGKGAFNCIHEETAPLPGDGESEQVSDQTSTDATLKEGEVGENEPQMEYFEMDDTMGWVNQWWEEGSAWMVHNSIGSELSDLQDQPWGEAGEQEK